ncbi:MAG: carboxypeptidase-like regulatory domain-containing protein, partial [Saprospiraceae bacterium]|nr:carboxypeptidase-like regulatory domain-containing protein [Saprospiraceae bacterium]
MFFGFYLVAQETIVFGVVVSGQDQKPIEFAVVNINNTSKAVETDSLGQFRMVVPANETFILNFSRIGFQETSITVKPMPAGGKRYLTVVLVAKEEAEVVVTASRVIDGGMVREEVTAF